MATSRLCSIRKRSPRWTAMETEALLDGVEQNKHVILKPNSSQVVNVSKQRAWIEITQMVNIMSAPGVRRTLNQVEQKWWDMKYREKLRAANPDQINRSVIDLELKLSYTHDRVMSIISNTPTDNADKVANTGSTDDENSSKLLQSITALETIQESKNLSNENKDLQSAVVVKEEIAESAERPHKRILLQKRVPIPNKKKKLDADADMISIQRKILLQLAQMQSTHSKILYQLEKRNEIERKKLELKEKKALANSLYSVDSDHSM